MGSLKKVSDFFEWLFKNIKTMKSGNVLLGVLAGVAAGALLGILLAPEKGSVTRKKIVTTGEDLVDNLKEKFNEFLDDITEKFEVMKEDAAEYIDPLTAKAEELKKDVKAAAKS